MRAKRLLFILCGFVLFLLVAYFIFTGVNLDATS